MTKKQECCELCKSWKSMGELKQDYFPYCLDPDCVCHKAQCCKHCLCSNHLGEDAFHCVAASCVCHREKKNERHWCNESCPCQIDKSTKEKEWSGFETPPKEKGLEWKDTRDDFELSATPAVELNPREFAVDTSDWVERFSSTPWLLEGVVNYELLESFIEKEKQLSFEEGFQKGRLKGDADGDFRGHMEGLKEGKQATLISVKEMVEGMEKQERWRNLTDEGMKAAEAMQTANENTHYNAALTDLLTRLEQIKN